MLNKDEYNQEEYENYYAQEVRGAEILATEEEDNNGTKIIIIILLLILIAIVGYFVLESVKGTNIQEETSSVAKDDKKESDKKIETDEITEKVKTITTSKNIDDKINPEDIANIVKMVMMKMNEEKQKEQSSKKSEETTNEEVIQDNKLMESLSGTEVDSISSLSNKPDSSKKETMLTKETDIYNKVVLEEEENSTVQDDLSKISSEISSIVESEEENSNENDNSYTASIKKEAEIRKKEMRYIIVKEGDTLGKIAKKYYGNVMEYRRIYEANPDILRRPDKIYIGQKLRIP